MSQGVVERRGPKCRWQDELSLFNINNGAGRNEEATGVRYGTNSKNKNTTDKHKVGAGINGEKLQNKTINVQINKTHGEQNNTIQYNTTMQNNN